MAIRHIPDGQDFGPEHFSKDFGFRGSATPTTDHTVDPRPKPRRGGVDEESHQPPPFAADQDTKGFSDNPEPTEGGHNSGGYYARGGEVDMMHDHPHGHEVRRTVHHADGRTVEHHTHGGHSVYHADGHITHHMHDGSPITTMPTMTEGYSSNPLEDRHDSSEYAHRARGGHIMHEDDDYGQHHMSVRKAQGGHISSQHEYELASEAFAGVGKSRHREPEGHASGRKEFGGTHLSERRAKGGSISAAEDKREDKAMIKSAFRQHDEHEHDGAHEDIKLARGGALHMNVPLPRGMKPHVARHMSPIETPPRNPNLTTTPRNEFAGGQMPYGVEPSAEPDQAGSEQDIPQMARGGRHRSRA